MAKKIRFPLVMADDTEVRDLDELREHFDLESVLGYYESGKLLTWLRDRYLEDEADAVEELDKSSAEFQQQLCAIFGVDYTAPVDQEAVVRRQERLKKLRTFTDEEEFIDHIDQVAFDQEELADLLDEGVETIYLCGKKFSIPLSVTNVRYVGIGDTEVRIPSKTVVDFGEKNISFAHIQFDEKYRVLAGMENTDNKADPEEDVSECGDESYEKIIEKIKKKAEILEYRFDIWRTNQPNVYSFLNYEDLSPNKEYSSKSDCERAAVSALQRMYNKASSATKEFFSTTDSKSAFKVLISNTSNELNKDIREMKELTRKLKDEKNVDAIATFESSLTTDACMLAIKDYLREEVKAYHLPEFSTYKYRIDYQKNDPSEYEDNPFAKMIAKGFVKYSFQAESAAYEIAADCSHLYSDFQEKVRSDCRSIIVEKLTDPILSALDKLCLQLGVSIT